MRVLHVVNAWPSEEHPIKGIFIQEQIESLSGHVTEQDTFIISGSSPLKYLKSIPAVMALKGKYDVIHAHHVLSAAVAIMAAVPKHKLVVSFLNERGKNVLRVPTWLSSALERIVVARTTVSIFKNNSFGRFRRKQDVVIGNAVDPERFPLRSREEARIRLGLERDGTYLLFVSANDLHRPAKRYDRFLQVLNELARRGRPAMPLCLVNEPRDMVPWYFAAADVLVVCAEHEGSPNVVKEALASGVPVVSTDVGDVRHQIHGLPGSRVLSTFSLGEFADAVVNAVSDSTHRRIRREAFLGRAPSKEDVARRISSLYHMLVS